MSSSSTCSGSSTAEIVEIEILRYEVGAPLERIVYLCNFPAGVQSVLYWPLPLPRCWGLSGPIFSFFIFLSQQGKVLYPEL